jgi:hypothetical protein
MRRSTTLNAQASVAWSRTRHAGLDGVLRPSSFDSPVVVKLLAGRRLGQKWTVSGSFKYLTADRIPLSTRPCRASRGAASST